MERDFLSLNWKTKPIAKNSGCDIISPSTPQFVSLELASRPPSPFAKLAKVQNVASTLQQQSIVGFKSNAIPKPLNLMAPNSGNNPPLTIFYSGAVLVYPHISQEKVDAIIRIARNGSTGDQTKQIPHSVLSANQMKPNPTQISSQTFKRGGIHMARKATLARFLQNRKARWIEGMPYNVSGKLGGHQNSFSAHK